jgi:hypothetical protein
MAKRLFYTKFGWEDNSISDIERNIKLFALINTDVVIPSNHIYSQKAELIFSKNPELLELNIIRPALGSEYSNYSEYLGVREKKAGRDLSNYGKFLDSLKSSPMYYTGDSPANIFTDGAIEQIQNSNSVLRKTASINQLSAKLLIDEIGKYREQNNGVIYFRDFLQVSKKLLEDKSYQVVDKYAHLLRYISGASSKNCNNLLPQENLIDWCLANPNSKNEFVLADEQLFWEVFLESIIRLTEGIVTMKDLSKVSPAILDRLNYTDISSIRNESVLHNKFVSKYETIIDRINTIRTTSKNNIELVDFDELISLKEQLRVEFQNSINDELSIYKKIEIIEALAKIAYQLWGGTLQSIESVVNFFSIVFNKKKNWEDFLRKQEIRAEKAKGFAQNRISKETVLIDYMDKIVNKTKEAWYR